MSYKIPLFNLNFDEKEEQAVVEVLKSKWISSGPKCQELENAFAAMLNVKYAVAVSSCTAALHLAMIGADVQVGDEVIVPSLTFVATANSIRYVGGIPVFCDIESAENPVICAKNIEPLITSKTKAIVVMHYAGFSCDMNSIVKLAKQHDLKVIEDACHGPLSKYENKCLGTIGDIGCFSFFSNKNISTGEGGVLVTNNHEVYNRCKLLRSHGMTTMSYERANGHSANYDVVELGYNYRLDDIRASIGIEQLKKLPGDIQSRQRVRELYIEQLSNETKLIIPFKNYKSYSSLYIFPLVLKNGNVEKRNKIREYLADNGIQTSVHYPPVHRFKIYHKFVNNLLPVTEYVSDCEFTLPMYAALKEPEINYICKTLKEGLKLL